MRVIIQRVSEASVTIDNQVFNSIGRGVVLLIGFDPEDNTTDIEWIVKKIVNMRIFPDEQNHMNLSLKDINGEILLISQFTLYASTKKGNRPSFIGAAKPDTAIPLYETTINSFNGQAPNIIKTGKFGADMKVALINDGPVTITIDSKSKT